MCEILLSRVLNSLCNNILSFEVMFQNKNKSRGSWLRQWCKFQWSMSSSFPGCGTYRSHYCMGSFFQVPVCAPTTFSLIYYYRKNVTSPLRLPLLIPHPSWIRRVRMGTLNLDQNIMKENPKALTKKKRFSPGGV